MISHLTIDELQSAGRSGSLEALQELGRKVLDMNFCYGDLHAARCDHLEDLVSLQFELDCDIPTDCPHCGKWLTDK